MRIFVCEVGELLAGGLNRSDLVRRLLAYAVREVWGVDMPKICKNEKGKPYFADGENMHFSLSHTKTHVLAVVSEHPVGGDIETLREIKSGAERLFSREMLRDFGYFGGWTLREAVYKLCGEGSLRDMDIRLVDGEIVTPFKGVRCALYTDIPNCAAALAWYEGEAPEKADIVASELIFS